MSRAVFNVYQVTKRNSDGDPVPFMSSKHFHITVRNIKKMKAPDPADRSKTIDVDVDVSGALWLLAELMIEHRKNFGSLKFLPHQILMNFILPYVLGISNDPINWIERPVGELVSVSRLSHWGEYVLFTMRPSLILDSILDNLTHAIAVRDLDMVSYILRKNPNYLEKLRNVEEFEMGLISLMSEPMRNNLGNFFVGNFYRTVIFRDMMRLFLNVAPPGFVNIAQRVIAIISVVGSLLAIGSSAFYIGGLYLIARNNINSIPSVATLQDRFRENPIQCAFHVLSAIAVFAFYVVMALNVAINQLRNHRADAVRILSVLMAGLTALSPINDLAANAQSFIATTRNTAGGLWHRVTRDIRDVVADANGQPPMRHP